MMKFRTVNCIKRICKKAIVSNYYTFLVYFGFLFWVYLLLIGLLILILQSNTILKFIINQNYKPP